MRNCRRCGGRVRRIHRTFWERFSYLAIYECRDCRDIITYQQPYRHHLGPHCRCPRCGTLRVTRLKERDHIDPLNTGILNFLERLAGGRLYHCRFCRVQFYDRRSLAPEISAREEAPQEERKSAAN